MPARQSTPRIDYRPRFGWATDLDNNPQIIHEKRTGKRGLMIPVVVIPLPYASAKIRHKVREFTKSVLWP